MGNGEKGSLIQPFISTKISIVAKYGTCWNAQVLNSGCTARTCVRTAVLRIPHFYPKLASEAGF